MIKIKQRNKNIFCCHLIDNFLEITTNMMQLKTKYRKRTTLATYDKNIKTLYICLKKSFFLFTKIDTSDNTTIIL